jgi:hypothetical protein
MFSLRTIGYINPINLMFTLRTIAHMNPINLMFSFRTIAYINPINLMFTCTCHAPASVALISLFNDLGFAVYHTFQSCFVRPRRWPPYLRVRCFVVLRDKNVSARTKQCLNLVLFCALISIYSLNKANVWSVLQLQD